MKRKLCVLTALFASIAMCSASLAEPRNENGPSSSSDGRSEATDNLPSDAHAAHAFLGVAVESVNDSLRSHLQNQISDGSGLLVEDVAEGSPAAKAGLQQHDILVSFDDQKLYSPEQLVKLVGYDKPGREAKLHIVRAGKPEEVRVTLGSSQMASGHHARRAYSWRMANQRSHSQDQQGHESQQDQRDDQRQSFDSMTLSRVDDKHFKAEIRYRDDQGSVESRTFHGTSDEIREKIENQKDLPSAERARLLRALDMANTPGEVEFQEFHLSNQRS